MNNNDDDELELFGLTVTRDGRVFRYGVELRQYLLGRGVPGKKYKHVWVNGKHRKVHRLVATAFHPNPENKPQVAHWDGDPHHNHADNLRWATRSENQQDSVRHGTSSFLNHGYRGSKHGRSKLTEEQVLEIRALRESGCTTVSLSNQFGVSDPQITRICTRQQWDHLAEAA